MIKVVDQGYVRKTLQIKVVYDKGCRSRLCMVKVVDQDCV